MLVAILIAAGTLSGCKGMVNSSGGSASKGDTPVLTPPALTPPVPQLKIQSINSIKPTTMVTGLDFVQVLEFSNPDSPSIPLTVTSVSSTPSSGVSIDLSACTGVILDGTRNCRARVTYQSASPATLTAEPVFHFTYTQEGISKSGTRTFPVEMDFEAPSPDLYPEMKYPNTPLVLTDTGFPQFVTPTYSFDFDPSSVPLVQFVPKHLHLWPEGIKIREDSGKVEGALASGSLSLPVCLMVDGVLTDACSNVRIKGHTEAVRTADSSPCAGVEGDGSTANPYVIRTKEEFDSCLRNHSSKHFILGESINFSGFPMEPIQDFSGTLDGQGNALSEYAYTDATSGLPFGLFRSVLPGAVIKNLSLMNFNLNGTTKYYVGMLAGRADDALLSDIQIVNGSVTAEYGFGALVGLYVGTGTQYSGGAITRIQIENIELVDSNKNGEGWSVAGGAVGIASLFTPVRVSQIQVKRLNMRQVGSVVGGIVGTSWVGLVASPITDRPLSQLWLDGATSQGDIEGAEFLGGSIGFGTAGDLYHNLGSEMVISTTHATGRIGGLIGAIGGNAGNASLTLELARSYFAGTINPRDPRYAASLIGDTDYMDWNGTIEVSEVYAAVDSETYPFLLPGNPHTAQPGVEGTPESVSVTQLQDPTQLPFWSLPWVHSSGSLPTLSPE